MQAKKKYLSPAVCDVPSLQADAQSTVYMYMHRLLLRLKLEPFTMYRLQHEDVKRRSKYTRHTLPRRHSQSKSDQACYSSLPLIAARLILSFPGAVRLARLCSQVCPLASFQKATWLEPGRICSGPRPFLAMSYSAASTGYNNCNELQMQAFLLAQ